MTDEELIAKFQARVADGEIDLRPLGELIFGKFDQDWPARLIALARRGAAVCQIPAGEITDLDLAKIKEAVAGARHGPKGCLLLKTEDVAALIARLEASDARNATAYAEGKDEGATATLEILAAQLSVNDWTAADGSETWDGDVSGTVYNILRAAAVYEDEEGTIATHGKIATAYAEGVEAAMRKAVDAAIEQADMRDEVSPDTSEWQVYNHAAFKLTTLAATFRSLLKDKPNG